MTGVRGLSSYGCISVMAAHPSPGYCAGYRMPGRHRLGVFGRTAAGGKTTHCLCPVRGGFAVFGLGMAVLLVPAELARSLLNPHRPFPFIFPGSYHIYFLCEYQFLGPFWCWLLLTYTPVVAFSQHGHNQGTRRGLPAPEGRTPAAVVRLSDPGRVSLAAPLVC